jgi:hypothetical protein
MLLWPVLTGREGLLGVSAALSELSPACVIPRGCATGLLSSGLSDLPLSLLIPATSIVVANANMPVLVITNYRHINELW